MFIPSLVLHLVLSFHSLCKDILERIVGYQQKIDLARWQWIVTPVGSQSVQMKILSQKPVSIPVVQATKWRI